MLPQVEEPVFGFPESHRFLMLSFLDDRGSLRFLIPGLQVPKNKSARESQVLLLTVVRIFEHVGVGFKKLWEAW